VFFFYKNCVAALGEGSPTHACFIFFSDGVDVIDVIDVIDAIVLVQVGQCTGHGGQSSDGRAIEIAKGTDQQCETGH